MNQPVAAPSQFVTQVGPSQPIDPLIGGTGEDWILIGIGGFAILAALIIGFFNRCLDDALFFALAVSLIVIVLAVIV